MRHLVNSESGKMFQIQIGSLDEKTLLPIVQFLCHLFLFFENS